MVEKSVTPMTTEENAIATLKNNLHFPGDGFHILIIELCKEFQLPFQKVRAVLKKSQASIEKKIHADGDSIKESDLTKENWLRIIREQLIILEKETIPVMDALEQNERYKKIQQTMVKTGISLEEKERLLNDLNTIYEQEIYTSLSAMLHTSYRYWELSKDLNQMTKERCQKFSDYPQHMSATEHLQKIKTQIISS